MSVIAIIPARGGSKGLPRKNLLRVGGIPLIGRAVIAASGAPSMDRVVVSTDDPEISQTARSYGAEIITRPSELATDQATSESAIEHCIKSLNLDPNSVIVFLQCTSPFTDGADIQKGIDLVVSGRADSVFSAVKSHAFLWKDSGIGGAVGINHDAENQRARRQDIEPDYRETGGFYIFKAGIFLREKTRFAGFTKPVEVQKMRDLDIDDEQDFKLATTVANLFPRTEQLDIQGIVFDFDGVHTDNYVYLNQEGVESVRASRADGLGIELLRNSGMPMLVLSKEKNSVVSERCKKLRLECIQGLEEKLPVLELWASRNGLELARTAYVGNDVNDLSCMGAVGWPIAVGDAVPEVRLAARLLLHSGGGSGAIRELADLILENNKDR